MPRLIDADKVAEAIAWLDEYDFVLWHDVMECIDKVPTVDAELVRHGHWTKERNPMMYQLIPYVWVCDQCGTAFYYKTPYCGECKAKMDEEEK